MLENRRFEIKKTVDAAELMAHIEEILGDRVIRWYVSAVHEAHVVVEATFFHEDLDGLHVDGHRAHYAGKRAVLNIVPTGIGCDIGGYAGDAAPVTNLLAGACDYLITNPNAVNASNFISLKSNVLYVDGAAIDLFARGKVDLAIPHANRIGLIVEESTDEDVEHVLNVVNAIRAIHGVHISDVICTKGSVGSRCEENGAGAFVGTVDHPERLFDAASELLSRGCSALAVTTNVKDLPADSYAAHFSGNYPNPVGGVEAIISNLLQKKFRVPVAHAPMINFKDIALEDKVVDARGAGEMVSISGLACILMGLHRAPHSRELNVACIGDRLNYRNLAAVVVPASCLGGIPTLAAYRHGTPIIAVRQNGTVLDVTASALGMKGVVVVDNYLEAAGVLVALQQGLALDTLSRPLHTLRPADMAWDVATAEMEAVATHG